MRELPVEVHRGEDQADHDQDQEPDHHRKFLEELEVVKTIVKNSKAVFVLNFKEISIVRHGKSSGQIDGGQFLREKFKKKSKKTLKICKKILDNF